MYETGGQVTTGAKIFIGIFAFFMLGCFGAVAGSDSFIAKALYLGFLFWLVYINRSPISKFWKMLQRVFNRNERPRQ